MNRWRFWLPREMRPRLVNGVEVDGRWGEVVIELKGLRPMERGPRAATE